MVGRALGPIDQAPLITPWGAALLCFTSPHCTLLRRAYTLCLVWEVKISDLQLILDLQPHIWTQLAQSFQCVPKP